MQGRTGRSPHKAVLVGVLVAILLGVGLMIRLHPLRCASSSVEQQPVQSSQENEQLPEKSSVASGHKDSNNVASRSSQQFHVKSAALKVSASNTPANSRDSAKRTPRSLLPVCRCRMEYIVLRC